MICIISLHQIMTLKTSDIEQLSVDLSKQIDDTISQLQVLLDQKSISDLFEPVYNATIPTSNVLFQSNLKWNTLINVTRQSHQVLLDALNNNLSACHVKRKVETKQMDVFNSRIVDLNNVDAIFEDRECDNDFFLEAMRDATFNSLFPLSIDNSRIQNRYSSVILADLETKNQFRYPSSGAGFDDVNCIKDQFAQTQQIIVGLGSESTNLIHYDHIEELQGVNATKSFENGFVFKDRCIDRSVRVFVGDQQHVHNKVPQVLTGDEIQDFLKSTNLVEPSINQIVFALQQIYQELIADKNSTRILTKISGSTIFRPTEIVILANCVNTSQLRRIQKVVKRNQDLFSELERMNIHVEFKQSGGQAKNCLNLDYLKPFSRIFQDNDVESDKTEFKLLPAKVDEFGQTSFSFCSKSSRFLVCSKVPQQGFVIHTVSAVVFEKYGQVLIVDRETLMIYVDSFNQFVGKQFGQHVGNEMNQSTLNLIQSKSSNIIKLDNIIISSCHIDANLIYVMYLRVPVKYTSVTYNKNLFSNVKFNAQDLCFNLSYYDQQCNNKLLIYFPQEFIGSNYLSPKESVFMKGVTMTPETSSKFANFLQFEYDYTKLSQMTYFSIFNETLTGNSFTIFEMAHINNFNTLKNTYDFMKQNFNDMLYVGRAAGTGAMSIYPDNKLTQKTLGSIYNISLNTISDNQISKAGIILKDLDCEYHTESGVIQDTCLYIGIPFTNYLLAQDYFVVKKNKAFLLFLQNNQAILDKLDDMNLKFVFNSPWNSLSYNCSNRDFKAIHQILFGKGLGLCELKETSSGIESQFKILDQYFTTKKQTDEKHVIVPLTSSKSSILVFSGDYYLKQQLQCQKIQSQSKACFSEVNLVKQWTEYNPPKQIIKQINIGITAVFVFMLIILAII
ncbi:Conserved_hypothetical protein [Hexamita inflata]|uniref:Uncharacterized protein n=1 Tax=Hexamita inflata TaxID=28002 RepID=A0AA86NW36_9EUKA|nr:Conserved hypothetical protein [Hexamita inflata]